MPKLVNLVPKYRKHKQSGQAIVTLNGRDHLLGPHGTRASKLEYDRLIAEWLSSGRSPAFGACADDLLIVELAADYLRYLKAYHGNGRSSEWHRVRPLLGPLRDLYGRTPASGFGPLQLRTVRQKFIDRGGSRSYVNHNTQRLVRMFRWAAAEGRISPLVPQSLAMVPGLRKGKTDAPETAPVMPVDAETVEATLPFMPEIPADMVRFQRQTGCRPDEVCILRPCDLDRTGDVWLYRPHRHKTEHHGHGRVVLIGPKTQALLLKYLAHNPEAYCFRPCDSMAKYLSAKHATRVTPLSCGNRPGTNRRKKPRKAPGERYEVDAYRRAIARACDQAFPHPEFGGVPLRKLTGDTLAAVRKWQSSHRWAPNQLRHAAATEVRREFGLEAAQIVLGHSKANVTQVYAERDLAKGLEVARLIG